jgi:hypothetical protein
MTEMEIEAKYGKDVSDLVKKIEAFLEKSLKHQSFNGVYAECSEFCMTDIPDLGVFLVKFPKAPPVALAGLEMVSGDYVFKSTKFGDKTLNIYTMDNFNMERLVSRAEYEWSMDLQEIAH